jgi:hypothetical protein
LPYKNPEKDRNYRAEYEKFLALGGRKKQTERQRARRAWDKEHGKESREGKALDHVTPIKHGGKSSPGNIKLTDFSANSSRNFKTKKK